MIKNILWLFVMVKLLFIFFLCLDKNVKASTVNEDERLTIFDVHPKTKQDVDFLEKLMMTESKLDFWKEPTKFKDIVTFTVPKDSLANIRQQLTDVGLTYNETVHESNHNQKRRVMLASIFQKKNGVKQFDLHEFNTLENITSYLFDLRSSCPTDINCSLYNIGNSYEGRKIMVFKISRWNGQNKKGIWIDATIHAREWLATATTLKILNHLFYHQDSISERLVNSYDWYIAPVVNPDGYVYTFTHVRLWRKNRRPLIPGNDTCVGVDLNRNFDFRWGSEDSSQNVCSYIYGGPHGGSEPEVQAIQNEARRLGPSLISWVTIHSYGRMWMFPYGTTANNDGKTCLRTNDYEDLMGVANAAADAVQRTYDTKWKRGTTCEVIYPNSGSSLGYIKDVAGVKYAYGLELRGKGFDVNSTEIHPSFVEIWNGLVAMCDAISGQLNRSSEKSNGVLLLSVLFQVLTGNSTT